MFFFLNNSSTVFLIKTKDCAVCKALAARSVIVGIVMLIVIRHSCQNWASLPRQLLRHRGRDSWDSRKIPRKHFQLVHRLS